MPRSASVFASTVLLLLASGCREKDPGARIDGLRAALASGNAETIASATRALPSCPDSPPVALAPGQSSPRDKGCLSEIANAFGSKKGFSPIPPDQAATATAALVIVRDKRGDLVAHSDVWLGAVKAGKGAGTDALRLAMADSMEKGAQRVGRALEDEADMRAALAAVAASVPGACPAYALLGAGASVASLAPEIGPDHAACVQRDLGRREGPGPSYGSGLARGLEGALALYREAERALRMGLPHAAPDVARALEAKLAVVEAASARIQTKKVARTTDSSVGLMGDLHAQAGVLLWKDAGAGVVDGGVVTALDAGIRFVPAAPRLVPVPPEPRREPTHY